MNPLPIIPIRSGAFPLTPTASSLLLPGRIMVS
jgi:hypothetical protein